MSSKSRKKSIVIFEDKNDVIEKMKTAFERKFRNTGIPIKFFDSRDSISQQKAFEERLKEDLKQAKYGNIRLIVCDQDLSGTEKYAGLSARNVSYAADELALPICIYAQGIYKDILEKLKRWTELKIVLDISGGYRSISHQCRVLYDGFKTIELKYRQISGKTKEKHTLPDTLARILGKPHLKDRIVLYGAGDKQMLGEILPYRTRGLERIKDENKRIPRLLGYWLWNSILRFPGILLNQVATTSFLNIDEKQFQKNRKLQALFKKAIYHGPFSNIQNYWWRDDLENILFKKRCEDGLQLAIKKGFKNIHNCKCSVNPKKRAGYYCMITEKPVSDQNSYANINWFPAGADLARISKPIFDELAPWLGLF